MMNTKYLYVVASNIQFRVLIIFFSFLFFFAKLRWTLNLIIIKVSTGMMEGSNPQDLLEIIAKSSSFEKCSCVQNVTKRRENKKYQSSRSFSRLFFSVFTSFRCKSSIKFHFSGQNSNKLYCC